MRFRLASHEEQPRHCSFPRLLTGFLGLECGNSGPSMSVFQTLNGEDTGVPFTERGNKKLGGKNLPQELAREA